MGNGDAGVYRELGISQFPYWLLRYKVWNISFGEGEYVSLGKMNFIGMHIAWQLNLREWWWYSILWLWNFADWLLIGLVVSLGYHLG